MKARDGSALRCSVALDDHDGLVGIGDVILPGGTKIPVPLCEAHGYVRPWSAQDKRRYEYLKRELLRHVGPNGILPERLGFEGFPNDWVFNVTTKLVAAVAEADDPTGPNSFCGNCGERIEQDEQACASSGGLCRPAEERHVVVGQQFCVDCKDVIEQKPQVCAVTLGWCRPQGGQDG